MLSMHIVPFRYNKPTNHQQHPPSTLFYNPQDQYLRTTGILLLFLYFYNRSVVFCVNYNGTAPSSHPVPFPHVVPPISMSNMLVNRTRINRLHMYTISLLFSAIPLLFPAVAILSFLFEATKERLSHTFKNEHLPKYYIIQFRSCGHGHFWQSCFCGSQFRPVGHNWLTSSAASFSPASPSNHHLSAYSICIQRTTTLVLEIGSAYFSCALNSQP